MQVKKFPEGDWWRKDFWFLPNELRNICESLEGQIKSFHGEDYFSPEAYADLERRFKGKAEYLTFSYSDYGGDVLQRLVCDSLDRLHKKPEKELTDKEREIVDGSAYVGAAYGGEEWAVWHPALVADLKVWNSELYSHGLDWAEVLFGGYWEDALSQLELKLYDKAMDYLEESYPGLKGDESLGEMVMQWLELNGNVLATSVDYYEGKLMQDIGQYVMTNHTAYSDDDKPLPFYWLQEEHGKAEGDAMQLPDGEYRGSVREKIRDAFRKALEGLGYAFAKGNAEEWSEENKNFGWLPWNK